MGTREAGQRRGGDQRCIARQDDHHAVVVDLACSRLDRAAGPVRARLDDAPHPLGEMAAERVLRRVHDHDLVGPGRERGCDRPFDKRPATDLVQHLRQPRTHARALAGGEDDGGELGHERILRLVCSRTLRPIYWGVV